MYIDYLIGNKIKTVLLNWFGTERGYPKFDYFSLETDFEVAPWKGLGVEWGIDRASPNATYPKNGHFVVLFHLIFFDIRFRFACQMEPQKHWLKEEEKIS